MDDDLLADDGQYKDDGLDDLDIDAEAALLGLSDDEIEDDRSHNDEQELEFVDEDGNPVSIGENNADLYEVANIESDKLSNPPDEDVLELDLDAELDSFTQETSELLNESPTPTKSYNERQRKDNLISLTNRKEQERPAPPRRKESRYSPEEDQDRSNKDVSFSQSHTSRIEHRDSFGDELEFDEESEDESIADDHRERFKSERSNIITLTPAKRRADIPDTLESVISVEETAKVQAFLENEQKRKMRFKGKMHGRMKPSPRFQRPPQNFSSPQVQQPPPQFSSSNAPSVSQPASTAPQPRKILINPHFRGIRIPPAEPGHAMNETPQASVPPPSYEPQNFPPPVQYSHQEAVHPVSVAPPPIYTAPPPAVQYKHPEYPPPQQPIQQMPPPTWQSPDMTAQTYSMPPPPVMNYGDPAPQPPNYNNYNQNFQNTGYQAPSMPMPQSVNYSQPPPPVHLYTQSFPVPPVNPPSSSMAHNQFTPTPNQMRMQGSVQNLQPQSYQETSMSQSQMASHAQKPRFNQNHQRFSRPPEKRMSNTNIKQVPIKQARLEHPQRKTNLHVNNSNIREIPLIDTLPTTRKTTTTAIKTVPIVEDEDEKTKELRRKIEEQKLLREQILKRKEERRRQMAAQRLSELKKRQAEQNKNTVTIIPKAMNQNVQVKGPVPVKPAVKPSVKERIGMPVNTNLPATKKKIVVVRKKLQQNPVVTTPPSISKPLPIVGQRLKLPVPSQRQNNQPIVKPTITAPTTTATITPQNNVVSKPISFNKPVTNDSAKPPLPAKPVENKPQVSAANQKTQATGSKKIILTSQAQKGKNLRLGNRPPFQRPRFSPPMHRMHRPRVPGPRGAQFQSPPFGEHRMPFRNHHGPPPPMNEMRMPPPHFQESRPPLLPFHPPGPGEHGPFNNFFPRDLPYEHPPNSPPFRMRAPGLPNFRPGGMEPMFHDRFPPPQFRNQMPQLRHMVENNMQRFQRPRFHHHQGKQKFSPNNSINSNQKPPTEVKTFETKSPASAPISQEPKTNQKPNVTAGKTNETKPMTKITIQNQPKNLSEDKNIPKTQSVSVANLSSSTNEAQLRKLCSTVGVVEKIQLLKSERKAVIKFKEPRQALNFQKKYQRFMLDLAMIQVSLLSS